MHKRTRKLLSIFISLLLFLIAVWAIRKSVAGHHPREIWRSIMDLPPSQIGWALLLIIVNFLLVAAMDTIAARFAGKNMSYFRMILPSFIGITFQYNAGFFGGGAMRFRLFSSLGLTARQTGNMLLLFSLAFSVSFCLLTGLALLVDPLEISEQVSWLPEVAGALLLAGCMLYFWLCARKKPLRVLRWKLNLPHIRASILQVLLATADWVVEAGILYVLLPSEGRASFLIFVSVFMLAHNFGVLSNTPGGIGVFEATILNLLPSGSAPTKMLGILLAYRGIYYVLPLLIATPLLGERILAFRLAQKTKTGKEMMT
ncbi:MAG: lysylphosphatidylglycerol synthase domain-containing protein [Candidatus Peribacteraceae bacterium]|nr:lysylphosphatidylglycerol synthase domain-containing protein [Candidatus Peribacteraceae bacterium]MDD5742581.1 lysylphosphatidylglycerol synthase domain-containing protein [Candidatus Peribacteraceae bacterium]